jgi:outer membrane protein TolC
LLSKESIEIQRKNIRSLTENLQETTQIYENGFAEEENVQQLQLTLSSLENNLKNLQNIHRISKGFLKLLLGMPLDTPIALTDDLNSLTAQQLMWTPNGNKFDLSNNIDYKIARNEVESNRLLYKRERFKKLPTVAAFVSASRLGYSDSFSNYFKEGQDWLSTSVAGASISIPIFTSLGGEALIKRTKINWQVSQNNLKETEEKLQLDIEKAESEYNALKYKEGMASSFELRQAQLQLYSSQQEYLQSMIEVINKKAEFKKIANIQ